MLDQSDLAQSPFDLPDRQSSTSSLLPPMEEGFDSGVGCGGVGGGIFPFHYLPWHKWVHGTSVELFSLAL